MKENGRKAIKKVLEFTITLVVQHIRVIEEITKKNGLGEFIYYNGGSYVGN